MKLLTTICMPALLLGAAALITPAMAQADAGASGNAAAAAPAQPAQDANSAAIPAQAAPAQDNSASTSSQTAMGNQASGNTQLAMNTTGNASDLSSIPDNQHKYSRAKKSADNRSEGQTTKDLNQKESSLSGGASSGGAQ
jgi:hypothetical protein